MDRADCGVFSAQVVPLMRPQLEGGIRSVATEYDGLLAPLRLAGQDETQAFDRALPENDCFIVRSTNAVFVEM